MAWLSVPRIEVFAHFLQKTTTNCVATKSENGLRQNEEIENIEALTSSECGIETTVDFVRIRGVDLWCREKDLLNFPISSFSDRSFDIGECEGPVFHFYSDYNFPGIIKAFEICNLPNRLVARVDARAIHLRKQAKVTADNIE